MSDDSTLGLKWGTVKAWSGLCPEAVAAMRKFMDGASFSAMDDHQDARRKELLCEVIRAHTGAIYNDWSGEDLTKDEAIKYVMEYGE